MLLTVTVVLVLGAGLAVGRLTASLPVPFYGQHMSRSWIADQLKLTSQQRQEMDAIWADAKIQMQDLGRQRHELDQQRDKAVRDLLTPEQQAAYDKIFSDYHDQRAVLDQQRADVMHDADLRSRTLLDDAQKATWDELTKQFEEHRGPHGPGGPDAQAATQNDKVQ
jgi:Spy/CpxP family protein refolding chaperone